MSPSGDHSIGPPPESLPVSGVVGRRQRAALRTVIWLAMIGATAGLATPDPLGSWLSTAAVALIAVSPLARVGWLVARWRQEQDHRFALVGLALLGIVAVGAMLTWLGVGR